MGFRFRCPIRFVPGLWVKLSKSGTSVSMGSKGATMNAGPNGTRSAILGWLNQIGFSAHRPAVTLLQQRLLGGPVADATLLCEAVEAGISLDRLGRAARRRGVVRPKDGLRGGLLWEFPAGKPGTGVTPFKQCEGMA